jgi:hypothetical protein
MLEFEDTDMDTVPPAIDIEYPCVVCGEEAGPYGGRGRKPTKCPKHKATQSGTSTKVKGANAALAAQATEALVQVNNILTMPLVLMGYQNSASALAKAQDGFRESTYQALLTDPRLCASIVRGGTAGGKVALLISYGMLGSAVGPVLVMEHKMIKAAREEQEG